MNRVCMKLRPLYNASSFLFVLACSLTVQGAEQDVEEAETLPKGIPEIFESFKINCTCIYTPLCCILR